MKQICFFNFHHNGDIFNNKGFVQEIMKSIPTEYVYSHPRGEQILKDLDLVYNPNIFNINGLDDYQMVMDYDNCVYVNTWIGSSFSAIPECEGNCSLFSIHKMFSKIYDRLNNIFDANLKISDPQNYWPEIDYKKFYIKNIDDFVLNNKSQKILFCNGPALSGQCHDYNGDMKDIIENLADKYEDKTFIATQKFDSKKINIKFTEDIIRSDASDLNEIAYLSTFCDVIIGRSSGPFCFCCNKDNMNDENKVFYCFGDRPTDAPPWNIDIKNTFIFEEFSNYENFQNSIFDLIV